MNVFPRALLPALATAVLAAGAAVPADAAKAPAKCKRAGSTTIAKSGSARVYELATAQGGTALYGCLLSTNRHSKLDEAYDDGYVSSYGYSRVRLAGRFVAWVFTETDVSCKAACPPGYDPTTTEVDVFDLRARSGNALGAEPAGSTLRVNSGGAAAWLQRLGGGQRDLHAWDADGHRVVDTGPIPTASYSLVGPKLSWANGDLARSITLR